MATGLGLAEDQPSLLVERVVGVCDAQGQGVPERFGRFLEAVSNVRQQRLAAVMKLCVNALRYPD